MREEAPCPCESQHLQMKRREAKEGRRSEGEVIQDKIRSRDTQNKQGVQETRIQLSKTQKGSGIFTIPFFYFDLNLHFTLWFLVQQRSKQTSINRRQTSSVSIPLGGSFSSPPPPPPPSASPSSPAPAATPGVSFSSSSRLAL